MGTEWQLEHGMAVIPDKPHLGGFIPGGDPATQYPEMWQWMIDAHKVRSVLDVGCGDGQAIDFFVSRGVEVFGIDGVDTGHGLVTIHDFSKGPCQKLPGFVDLVWSCEFVEHVDQRYVRNFLDAFARSSRFVLMTHGEPGQPGHHHVNNQTGDYWKGAMATIGFEFDEQLTQLTRGFSSANNSPWNHYRRSGLAFRRYS